MADGEKRFRCDGADDVIDLRSQLFAGLGRCGRDCDDDSGGLQLSQRPDGRAHRGSGRQTVIHQDHGPTTNIGGWTTAAVKALAPCQFLLFLCRHRIDHVARDVQLLHDLIVEDAHAAGSDRAHRQLLVTGNTQLAYDKDVKRRGERASHLIRDRQTTARQGEHQNTWTIGINGELFGQQPTRLIAIAKALWHRFPSLQMAC